MVTCAECGGACDGPMCGTHAAGCFYGGPDGGGYWFAVEGCEAPHDGDVPPLVGTAESARAAWEHLTQAGLRVTSESGGAN